MILNTKYILKDCKTEPEWKGITGKDIDGSDPAQGTNLGGYQEKSLLECKTLCELNAQCFSIHYHPWKNKDFSNCNLLGGIIKDQSQITNNGGDWTLYWLFVCTSGNEFIDRLFIVIF